MPVCVLLSISAIVLQ